MKVRVYTDYEPVRILRGVSKKDFTEPTDALALKCGLVGAFVEVDETEIPSDRTYRNAWKPENGKIVEDFVKVKKINDEIAEKEAQVLVQAKMKEMAVEALKVEGVFDSKGLVVK